MADGGENLASQAERWPWFIDTAPRTSPNAHP